MMYLMMYISSFNFCWPTIGPALTSLLRMAEVAVISPHVMKADTSFSDGVV